MKNCEVVEINQNTSSIEGKLLKFDRGIKFNFGYILYIPPKILKNPTLIIVGSNVSHTSNSVEEANVEVLKSGLRPNTPIYSVANKLGLPILYPLFPRICNENETIYNHMLSSNSLSNKTLKIVEYGLERVDLQLIEMIKDATQKLIEIGVEIDNKYIIEGFSASAKFANRFTLLHPELIKLCIAGGVSGILTLPMFRIKKEKLLWPIGIGNLEELSDIHITEDQINIFKQVRQFYYMGSEDLTNDPFAIKDDGSPLYSGIISKVEGLQLNKYFGNKNMVRWPIIQNYYNSLGVNAIFKTYEGFDHTPKPAEEDMFKEIEQLIIKKERQSKCK